MTQTSRPPRPASAEASGRRHRLPTLLAALAGLTFLAWPGQAAGQTAGGRLTSRPRPLALPVKALAVGEEIATAAGQRRRVGLPDGSVLYVNSDTRATLETARRLKLTAGEVYLEATARPAKEGEEPFVVRTPNREISGHGAHLAVRVARADTAVLVVRGQATLKGLARPLRAGQQVAKAGAAPRSAPRASHTLAWARELMIAAESPLVPGSKHAGGALIARDPNGQEASLSLRKYHVDVHIEDGFARTTIDQTYFNDSAWQLEGTFYFPLPPDASLSRLAMYVEGENGFCQLMEGGMAEAGHARQVYESIRFANRDPALLEWLDGSTFKMRVFPLEGRKEKRLLLSYTQRLESLYGRTTYRFPAGHTLQTVRDWSFHARIQGGAEVAWASPSHTLKAARAGKDLLLDTAVKKAKFDRDVVLLLTDAPQAAANAKAARFSSAEQGQARYLLVRYRPELSGEPRPQKRDWVFLFESSGDRDPLLARVQIDVIRHLLAHADPQDTFCVLAAGTRVRPFAAEPRKVTPENVQAAVAFLEKAHLVGALDLGKALTEAAALLEKSESPYLVHVGSGIAAMGERRQDVLVKRLPAATRYVGVGVGRRWNRALMKAAAERTGGLFAQVNPDEPVAWRAFDLAATLNTPRLLNVSVADADTGQAFLCHATALAQGEEVCAVTRLQAGKALPKSVVVRGTLAGKPFEQVLPVQGATPKADYLPRTWAKLEIERLLAEDAVKHKERIIALSKAMYVMTPYTSLLVLEHEDLYKQYQVDRGRKDHWALYPAPAKIPMVFDPDPSQPDPKLLKPGQKLPAREVLKTVMVRQRASLLGTPASVSDHGRPPWPVPPGGLTPEQGGLYFAGEVIFWRKAAGSLPMETLGGFLDRDGSISEVLSPRGATTPFIGTRSPEPAAESGKVLQADYDAPVLGPIPGRPRRALQVRMEQLLFESEDLRQMHDEVRRFWMNDDPSNLTYQRVHGGIGNEPLAIRDYPRALPLTAFATPRNVDRTVSTLLSGSQPSADFLYRRPGFRDDPRLFADLLSYAPGMNTSAADLLAVLEAEALPNPASRPGKVAPTARKLLQRARAAGWRGWTIAGKGGQEPVTIFFDGQGCYAYERIVSPGLKERVVCDGKTLLHLYPQLGLAARRAVSRFHRADLARLVPWAVPPAADLARGADVRLIAERTVAIIPRGADTAKTADGKPRACTRIHLLFAEDGRLAERQVVRMPKGEVLLRQVCTAAGVVRVLDGKGKELLTRKGELAPCQAPDLKPATKNLVVVPLPYRTREHVRKALKLENKAPGQLRFDEALPLLAATVAEGNTAEAYALFRQALHARAQRQLGYYVLLAACGQNLDADNGDVLAEHLDEPVAQYLALHSSAVLRKHASQWAVGSGQWGEGLLQHLAVSHALLQRWGSDKILKGSPARVQADIKRALEYVRRHKGTVWGWALLCLVQDRAGEDRVLHAAIADCFPLFEDMPGLRYAARYEHARSLWKAGKQSAARERFGKLYAETLKEGLLPALDSDFRQALVGGAPAADLWGGLLRDTAAKLIEDRHRPAVLALAWQCWQLDDRPLANHLLATALRGVKDEKERLGLSLAGIGFLWQTSQLPQADRLLDEVLSHKDWGKFPALWRLAGKTAGRRDQPARALECLERALDLEYGKLPKVVDLQAVRQEYGELLGHYQSLADAMVTLKVQPPAGFLARAVRAADRWRALDRDAAAPCQAVARILQRLGKRDLGWDYLTTPVGLRPNEAEPWVGLAQTLSQQGDLDLADRAFAAAYEAEPSNAQILWDRAENLRQAGRNVDAARLFRQIAEGRWQPRFQGLQAQARLQVQGGS